MTLSPADLHALARWDTPTICNALELVVPERRLTGFTVGQMVCLDPALPPVVGYARTAHSRTMSEPDESAEEIAERRMAYHDYLAQPPGPTVAVIEDIDPNPGYGAFWGEVATAVHWGLGCRGAITNGSMRDLDACAPGFQLLAGKVVPSHAWNRVVDFGTPVEIFGMRVAHGDIVHMDRHGAVVIPPQAVAELADAVDLIARREAVILEQARSGVLDIARLREATERARRLR